MNASTKPLGSIMVVDDTAENLRLLASMLGERGYEVRPVINGRNALQAAERAAPDLILLDITMPEMDGYEVCRRLKENAALRDVPVIFLTALTDTEDKLKAFGVGGLDYISKPFQIDEVLARVNVHLGLRRAQAELAQNYERLRELEILRDDLVHMVVHDMRTPLMVIMGYLNILEEVSKEELSAEGMQFLTGATEGVKSLTAMTNDLLDVSKMEAGKMVLNRQQCDLQALAIEVTGEISAMSDSRTITVDDNSPVRAEVDANIMRRILTNLIGNAVKHTPPGTAVRVMAQDRGASVRVAILDQGSGVPLEARKGIFEKFGAVTNRQDKKYHSVGLGLSFCRLAVEAHGGSIGVDSNEPRGSIFWFEIGK